MSIHQCILEVDEWLRGELPAKELTLRIFGGTARGVTYEADFAPSPEVMSLGAELLVLGSSPIVVPGDEPVSAMTPVGVHLVRGDRVINATLADAHGNLPEQVIDRVDAELLLRAGLRSVAAQP